MKISTIISRLEKAHLKRNRVFNKNASSDVFGFRKRCKISLESMKNAELKGNIRTYMEIKISYSVTTGKENTYFSVLKLALKFTKTKSLKNACQLVLPRYDLLLLIFNGST